MHVLEFDFTFKIREMNSTTAFIDWWDLGEINWYNKCERTAYAIYNWEYFSGCLHSNIKGIYLH